MQIVVIELQPDCPRFWLPFRFQEHVPSVASAFGELREQARDCHFLPYGERNNKKDLANCL